MVTRTKVKRVFTWEQRWYIAGVILIVILLFGSSLTAATGQDDSPLPPDTTTSIVNVTYDVQSITLTVVEEVAVEDPGPTMTDMLAELIYGKMRPQYASSEHITTDEAHRAANQIIYMMSEFNMVVEEDLEYILSIFFYESGFDPRAKNPYSSARGFGQIMGMHAWKFPSEGNSWRNNDDWQDVEQNIYVAFGIFSYDAPHHANMTPYNKWRHIYRYHYHTQQYGGTQYHNMFHNELESRGVYEQGTS